MKEISAGDRGLVKEKRTDMVKVFVDGSAGTTGLRIRERLASRDDIETVVLEGELRKDNDARAAAMAQSDITFLCLPDAAAKEAVLMAEGMDTVIIDTSTAHRVSPDWTYGFPELTGFRDKIKTARRIANPGCHASGFIALAAPLKEAGIIKHDMRLSCFSFTGYSGGGKNMIADYENEERDVLLDAPRMYGLGQQHKHLPEMAKYCGLYYDPIFCPVVADFYSGMEVVIPLFKNDIKGNIEDIKDTYRNYYREGLVSFSETADENGFLSAGVLAGKDSMELAVFGNNERILLVSRFDNLGKGASGAAIQNMNIVLGLDEKTGLTI